MNTPGPDKPVTNTKLNGEYVTIKNISSSKKTLTGYSLHDKSSHSYTFTTFNLAAGASVKVHTGKGTDTASNRYMNRGYYVWTNSGDTATLKSASGTTLDTCSWGSVASYVNC